MSNEENRENSNEQSANSDGSRRNRRSRNNRRYQKKDFPICPICGNSVKDINTAIAAEENEAPAHFDCIIKQLEEREQLEKDEKICYLGRGSFGVIKTRNGGSKFFVRKRIQFEKEEKKFDWRRKISSRIKK
ncbi:MAG: hypothetical protein JEZ04_02035 [Spirochaetales bacterium]|nr:hypothetical protein [Spirochaetales bacterium]